MRELGLAGNQPGPNTSKSHPEHVKFPYLLRGLHIIKPLHVWSTDITYIRLPGGFVYLVAVIRLVQPVSACKPPLKLSGGQFLCGGVRGGYRHLWLPRDFQYRSGRAIFVAGICERGTRQGDKPDFDT
jgi:hypothetical protein